jgi:hypothetical protein
MNSFNFDNYEYLLSLKPKHFPIIIIILVSIITILIYSFTTNTYDVYNASAYYECDKSCTLKISTLLADSGKITSASKLLINKNIQKIQDIDVSDIMNDQNNKQNYQIITYTIDKEDLKENTFQDVKIYYNEERIFNKIINYFIK